MSAKLDQSLDDIVKTDRRPGRGGNRARGRGGRAVVKSTKTSGPVGGVSKKVVMTKTGNRGKAGKAVTTTVTTTKTAPIHGSKIVVSNLPPDVSETQIKDYFGTTIGPIKKAELTYGPNGNSRGIATIFFRTADGASKAAKEMNGLKVDGKAMKVEIVVDAAMAPAPKSLSERMTYSQPKPATNGGKNGAGKAGKKGKGGANVVTTTTTQTQGRGKGRGGAKGRGNGRGKPKTAAELDAEMTDYFGTGEQVAATNGAEVGMTDEIM